MGGLSIWLRAEARRTWRTWLGVALIVGVGWGAVLTAAAGARRTETAFPRFLAFSSAPSVLVSPTGIGFKGFSADVARLPEVTSAGPVAGLNAFVLDPKPPRDFMFGAPFFPLDDRYGRTINRPKLLRGRLPDPNSATEVLVSPPFAERLHVDIGSHVTLRGASFSAPGTPSNLGRRFTVRIVGVGVTQNEAFPITVFDRVQPLMLLTPAAFRAYYEPAVLAFDGVAVRLRPGTNVGAFQNEVKKVLARHPEAGNQVFVSNELDRPSIVGRAIRPQVIALTAFAAALGITLVLVMIQTITRQILIQAAEFTTLRALGLTPRQLTRLALVPAAFAVVTGAVIAVGVAIAASPLTPIGAARVAEPHPGVAVDLPVLAIGSGVLVLLLVLTALLPARRAALLPATGEGVGDLAAWGRRSRLADGLASAGLSAPAAAGVRMALDPGRGRTAVPVRTVLVGAVVSMVALSAAFTFGASLGHTVTSPTLFGQRWDRSIDGQFNAVDTASLRLSTDPSYAAAAAGAHSAGLLVVNGKGVPAIGIDQLKGSIFPTLLEGRAPQTPDEIVLGSSTLRLVHARVGDHVTVDRDGRQVAMRVVGRAVFPSFGIGAFTPTGLGDGAAVTVDGLGHGGFLNNSGRYSFVLVRFSPHPSAEAVHRIDDGCRQISASGELCLTLKSQQPPEITSYTQVRDVPWLLAGVLGALAAATLTHGLLATVRRRRRDLALLKALGFVRRQVSGAVAWQATTLVAFSLVGIPVGIVAGRWAWTALANQLGILAEPRVPLATIALAIPGAMLFANIVAAIPARAASRTRAALVLRTE